MCTRNGFVCVIPKKFRIISSKTKDTIAHALKMRWFCYKNILNKDANYYKKKWLLLHNMFLISFQFLWIKINSLSLDNKLNHTIQIELNQTLFSISIFLWINFSNFILLSLMFDSRNFCTHFTIFHYDKKQMKKKHSFWDAIGKVW